MREYEDERPDLEDEMDKGDRLYDEFKSDLCLVENIWDAMDFSKSYPKEVHRVDEYFTAKNLEKVRMVLKLESCKTAFKVNEAVYYIALLDEVIEYIKKES